jgi:hypothetical protein
MKIDYICTYLVRKGGSLNNLLRLYMTLIYDPVAFLNAVNNKLIPIGSRTHYMIRELALSYLSLC